MKRFLRFRILQLHTFGVYILRTEGVVEYDSAVGGDVENIMKSILLYPGELLELEYSAAYGYITFKLENNLVLPNPMAYEPKVPS